MNDLKHVRSFYSRKFLYKFIYIFTHTASALTAIVLRSSYFTNLYDKQAGMGTGRLQRCPHCPLGGTIRAAVRRHLYLSEQVVVVVVAAVAYSSFDATSILPPSETTSFSPPSLCDLLMWNSHNHRLRVQLLKFFQIELCTPYFPFTQM